MKKEQIPSGILKFVIFVIAGAGLLLAREALAQSAHEFVGVKKCAMCHKTAAQGEQEKIWKNSKHAKAYEALATPESKAAAARLGIDDAQKSGKCLKCHSTSYNQTESQVATVVPVEEGVSCESCHGPGKDFMKMSVMKDRNAAIAAGLVIPDEKTCLKCHNEENPFHKPFSFQERLEKIKHPKPGK